MKQFKQILNQLVSSMVQGVELDIQQTAYTCYDDSEVTSAMQSLHGMFPSLQHLQFMYNEETEHMKQYWKSILPNHVQYTIPDMHCLVSSKLKLTNISVPLHQFAEVERQQFINIESQVHHTDHSATTLQHKQNNSTNSMPAFVLNNQSIHKGRIIAQLFNVELAPQSRDRMIRFANYQRGNVTINKSLMQQFIDSEKATTLYELDKYYVQRTKDGCVVVKVCEFVANI